MGHSHYFNIAPYPIDHGAWDRFTAACHAIVKIYTDRGFALTGDDSERPEISPRRVALNGVGREGCEPLVIDRAGGQETWSEANGTGWRFVKTYQRPYDLVVCAVLAVGKHFGVLTAVSSDGREDDWTGGLALAREGAGEEIRDPNLEDDEDDEDDAPLKGHVYQPMNVFSVTLDGLAELSAPGVHEPEWDEIQRTMTAIAGAFPLGLVVLAPGGTVVQGGEIVAAVRALMAPDVFASLGSKWAVRATPNTSTVPTAVLACGVATVREERRLQAAGKPDLVEALHHLHRRWQDHRVPVVRLARDSHQP